MTKKFTNQVIARAPKEYKPIRRSFIGVYFVVFGGLFALIGLIALVASGGDSTPVAFLSGISLVVTGLIIGVVEKIYSVLYEINEHLRTGK